jgi:UPF0755 protein
LFFVADGTGGHVFAETYEEHLRNVARWRQFNNEAAATAAAQAIERQPSDATASAPPDPAPVLDPAPPLALSPAPSAGGDAPFALQPQLSPSP